MPPKLPGIEDIEVFETFGRFEWFDLDNRNGFLREEGSNRQVLVNTACLREARIEKVSMDDFYRCQVLRRPQGLQAFRIWKK